MIGLFGGTYKLRIGLDLGEDTVKKYDEWNGDDNAEYAEIGKNAEKLMENIAIKVSDYLEDVEEAEWIDHYVDKENPNIIWMVCNCVVYVDTEDHFNSEPDYDPDPDDYDEPDYGDWY